MGPTNPLRCSIVCFLHVKLAPPLPKHISVRFKLPSLSFNNARLGVSHGKLVCGAAKLIRKRQAVGLSASMEAAKIATSVPEGSVKRKHVHTNYNHMWDEVAAKFKAWEGMQTGQHTHRGILNRI